MWPNYDSFVTNETWKSSLKNANVPLPISVWLELRGFHVTRGCWWLFTVLTPLWEIQFVKLTTMCCGFNCWMILQLKENNKQDPDERFYWHTQLHHTNSTSKTKKYTKTTISIQILQKKDRDHTQFRFSKKLIKV